MAGTLNGSFDQIRTGFGRYLGRWRKGLYPDYADTPAVQAFMDKKFSEAVQWAPARMIDSAEGMLNLYRQTQHDEHGPAGKLPVILLAMDDNFLGMGADWGGMHIGRRLLQIVEGGSWYGYKHVMVDRRVQVVIFASEGGSAQSLAAQMASFMMAPSNRTFDAPYEFGQYKVPMPVQLENNRVDWMNIAIPGDAKNLRILAADITLKCTIPMFDAPAPGEHNDGSTNTPPGYPLVQVIQTDDLATGVRTQGTIAGVDWSSTR
jgi:hypothetical protein